MSEWTPTQWAGYETSGGFPHGYRARTPKPIPAGRVRCGECHKDLVLKDGQLPPHKCDGGLWRGYYHTREDVTYETPAKAVGALMMRLDGPEREPIVCARVDKYCGTEDQRTRLSIRWETFALTGDPGAYEAYQKLRSEMPGA